MTLDQAAEDYQSEYFKTRTTKYDGIKEAFIAGARHRNKMDKEAIKLLEEKNSKSGFEYARLWQQATVQIQILISRLDAANEKIKKLEGTND